MVGGAIASGRTLDDVLEWSDRIDAVTPDEVNAAARDVIHDEVAVTGILLPTPGSHAPAAGLPVGGGAVQ
jgi:zinc protease